MSTRRRHHATELPEVSEVPVIAPVPSAQIIGLVKNRMSGITLSRHAYADVLRTIHADLRDSTTEEARSLDCPLNVWAARPLSPLVLDQMGNRKFSGKNIWCLVLESTKLPARTDEAAANADQIWVPTTFCRDICIAGGVPANKLFVVPYYIHPPDRDRLMPHPYDPFTVLVSWDGRSSLNRKNVFGCIAAFRLAFEGKRDVLLRLKTRDLSPENSQRLREEIGDDPRIVLADYTTASVTDMFDRVHCMLHLHRAEGYGRHIIEAMQRRVPVIATAYSGPMDWLTKRNAWLVDYVLEPTGQTEFQYPQGGEWAVPDTHQAAACLRAIYRASEKQLKKRLDAAEEVALEHSSLAKSRHAMESAFNQL